MIKLKKLFTLAMTICIGLLSSRVFAVGTRTLRQTKDTEKHGRSRIGGSYSILDMISMVNSYLRFFVGFFCFVFMIINGYKLISSNGDEKAMKTAKTGLFGSVIGIVICLLSYIIVNLAVNLLVGKDGI